MEIQYQYDTFRDIYIVLVILKVTRLANGRRLSYELINITSGHIYLPHWPVMEIQYQYDTFRVIYIIIVIFKVTGLSNGRRLSYELINWNVKRRADKIR